MIESIDKFAGCHNFENGFLYFECPSCDEFYMMRFSVIPDVPFLQEKGKDTGEFVVDMKCLECGYEGEIPLDIFSIPRSRKPSINMPAL